METSVEKAVKRLQNTWDSAVYVVYQPEREDPWLIRNHTDEGLPVDIERKVARGETLTQALHNAERGDTEKF